MGNFYTGVGSRATPPGVLAQMTTFASRLASLGFVLRSGAAEGADQAFEDGASGLAHIYTPWPGFNRRQQGSVRLVRPSAAAHQLAEQVHPAWFRLTQGARCLHARNCHQVLGDTLDTPSRLLICWTPDGCTAGAARTKHTGGTGTAIALASQHGVPVFNLQRAEHAHAVAEFIALEELFFDSAVETR